MEGRAIAADISRPQSSSPYISIAHDLFSLVQMSSDVCVAHRTALYVTCSPRSADRVALPAGEGGELGELRLRAQALDRVESLGEHRVGREAVHGGVA